MVRLIFGEDDFNDIDNFLTASPGQGKRIMRNAWSFGEDLVTLVPECGAKEGDYYGALSQFANSEHILSVMDDAGEVRVFPYPGPLPPFEEVFRALKETPKNRGRDIIAEVHQMDLSNDACHKVIGHITDYLRAADRERVRQWTIRRLESTQNQNLSLASAEKSIDGVIRVAERPQALARGLLVDLLGQLSPPQQLMALGMIYIVRITLPSSDEEWTLGPTAFTE